MSDPVHGGLLTVVDYGAIAILLGSMLLGMLRGLVRELFNLVGWVVAFFVARAFGPALAHWLPADLPGGEMTQGALGFLLVLVAVVFGAGIVSALVGRMTDLIGLRPADRGLGMMFGIVRGMLLLMLLMVAAKLTSLPQQPVWQQSLVRPWVEAGCSTICTIPRRRCRASIRWERRFRCRSWRRIVARRIRAGRAGMVRRAIRTVSAPRGLPALRRPRGRPPQWAVAPFAAVAAVASARG